MIRALLAVDCLFRFTHAQGTPRELYTSQRTEGGGVAMRGTDMIPGEDEEVAVNCCPSLTDPGMAG